MKSRLQYILTIAALALLLPGGNWMHQISAWIGFKNPGCHWRNTESESSSHCCCSSFKLANGSAADPELCFQFSTTGDVSDHFSNCLFCSLHLQKFYYAPNSSIVFSTLLLYQVDFLKSICLFTVPQLDRNRGPPRM